MSGEPTRGDEPVARSKIPPDLAPAEAVISAIATFEAVDITGLDIFHDVLDADALNRLIREGDDQVAVTFSYSGYVIMVRGDGGIIFRAAHDDG